MNCVVCDRPVVEGAERYANDWERVRKKLPCCSARCAGEFDPDRHWMPQVAPATASEEQQSRLIKVARARVRNGDLPTVIVREMLLAGVSALALRKVLGDAALGAQRSRSDTQLLNTVGVIGGLLGGFLHLFKSTDRREPAAIDLAFADLDRWERRWSPDTASQL